MSKYSLIFDSLLYEYEPKISDILFKLGITTTAFTYDWFFTMFGRAFDLRVSRSIWDIYFIFGPYAMFVTALSIFSNHREFILNSPSYEALDEVKKTSQSIVGTKLIRPVVKKVKLEH